MANRFRVRAMHKDYGDPGPDLLRPKENAQRQFANVMGTAKDGWFTRRNPPKDRTKWTDWQGPVGRAQALQAMEAFTRTGGDTAKFQVGRKASGKVEAKAECLVVKLRDARLANVNPGAELVASLFKTHYGTKVDYLGGFACREYNGIPGSGWSDHAWGDAVDMTIDGGTAQNDVLMNWLCRMGQARCLGDCAQLIGSKDGKVYTAYDPDYKLHAGGPSSHLTHVHASYRQHYGRDPGCS